jgi:hypothetical protein
MHFFLVNKGKISASNATEMIATENNKTPRIMNLLIFVISGVLQMKAKFDFLCLAG